MGEAFVSGGGGKNEGKYAWKLNKYGIEQSTTEAKISISYNAYVYYSDSAPELDGNGNLYLPNSQGGMPPSQFMYSPIDKYLFFQGSYLKATTGFYNSSSNPYIYGYGIYRRAIETLYATSDDPLAYPANGYKNGYFCTAITK